MDFLTAADQITGLAAFGLALLCMLGIYGIAAWAAQGSKWS